MNRQSSNDEFWELLSRHYDDLFRFALAQTNSLEDAEDLVGETVEATLRAFATMRDRAGFKSFLFTVCRRSHKRRMWRQFRFTPLHAGLDDRLAESLPTPETAADVRLLHEAIARLPRKLGEAVVLFELCDCTLKEVSEIQGASLSAVKARVVRGRRKLAELLGAEEAGQSQVKDSQPGKTGRKISGNKARNNTNNAHVKLPQARNK